MCARSDRNMVLLLLCSWLLTIAVLVSVGSADSGVRWSQLVPLGTLPPGRAAPSAMYDPLRDRVIAFGGVVGTGNFNDLWELTLGLNPQWTQLYPSGTTPDARQAHTAIYDLARDRMIVFGGYTYDPRSCFNDVWVLENLWGTPQWTQLHPTGTPPDAREAHTAIYDPVRERMVVFSGLDNSHVPVLILNDVWVLENLVGIPQWTQLHPAGTPPSPRWYAGEIYDPVRDQMVIFGGVDGSQLFNDVWTLSLGESQQWTQLAPLGEPPMARNSFQMIYEPVSDRLVVFGGGYGAYVGLNDVWALSLGGIPEWTELAPCGTAPSPRFHHAATYDAARQQMIVVMGEAGYYNYQNDAWALALGPLGPPSAASVECPADIIVPAYSTIPSLSLIGFRITNVDTIPSAFGYCVGATGPATLDDNGDPASLSGTTPLLEPGESYTPPPAALVIPAVRVHCQQLVGYHVGDSENSFCTTAVTFEPPVPVLVSAFDATLSEYGVCLTWDIVSDEDIMGFRIYRGIAGSRLPVDITSGGLISPEARVYEDQTVSGGETYEYTLAVVLENLSEMRSQMVVVGTKSYRLALHQNYPNPFNPMTMISFSVPEAVEATLSVYNIEGELVITLVNERLDSGVKNITWDGTDARGHKVGAGVYFYRLKAGGKALTKKMVLLK